MKTWPEPLQWGRLGRFCVVYNCHKNKHVGHCEETMWFGCFALYCKVKRRVLNFLKNAALGSLQNHDEVDMLKVKIIKAKYGILPCLDNYSVVVSLSGETHSHKPEISQFSEAQRVFSKKKECFLSVSRTFASRWGTSQFALPQQVFDDSTHNFWFCYGVWRRQKV